jgi:hypothetical protein
MKKEIADKEFYSQFQTFLIDNNIEYDTTPLKTGVKLSNRKTCAISKGTHTSKGHSKVYDFNKLRTLYFLDDEVL